MRSETCFHNQYFLFYLNRRNRHERSVAQPRRVSEDYFYVTILDKAERHADRQILRVDLVLFAESGSGVS